MIRWNIESCFRSILVEFKYPKSIQIGATMFRIKYDKKGTGASFKYPSDTEKATITFGMSEIASNPDTFLEYVLHELKEIIQSEQGSRLYNSRNDSIVFHYDHKEHDDLCSRLTGLLKEFIK